MGETDPPENKPPDPDDKIRDLVTSIVGDIDARVALEVEEQIKEFKAVTEEKEKRLKEEIKELKDQITAIKEIAEKNPSFARLLQPKNQEQRTSFNLTPFPNLSQTVAAFNAAATANLTPQNQRRPSASQRVRQEAPRRTEEVNPGDIRQQFANSKKKICCKPVTKQHIVDMYQQITSDIQQYSDDDIFYGEKHAQARIECGNAFLELELMMKPQDFKVVKTDYNRDLSKQTLIVSLESQHQVSRCFYKQAVIVQNRTVEIQNHYPPVSLQRRRVLFDWIRDAKKAHPERNYQLRLGDSDVKMFEKERGGTYHWIPLAAFAEEAGKDFATLPGLGWEREEKVTATGRGRDSKRENSSPEHREARDSKSGRVEAEDGLTPTAPPVEILIEPSMISQGTSDAKGESQAGERNKDSKAKQDEGP